MSEVSYAAGIDGGFPPSGGHSVTSGVLAVLPQHGLLMGVAMLPGLFEGLTVSCNTCHVFTRWLLSNGQVVLQALLRDGYQSGSLCRCCQRHTAGTVEAQQQQPKKLYTAN